MRVFGPKGLFSRYLLPHLGEFKDAGAEVVDRVGDVAVAHVEQAAVAVLSIVAADVDARVQGAEVPVIAHGGVLVTARGAAIDEHGETAGRSDVPSRNPVACRCSCALAAAAVAEGRRVQNNHQAVVTVVTAIAPVVHIVPQALDVAVLRTQAVGVTAALHGAGVVGHTVRITHVPRCAVVAAALSDGLLAVPVRKFDDVEQPDGESGCKVELPNVRA